MVVKPTQDLSWPFCEAVVSQIGKKRTDWVVYGSYLAPIGSDLSDYLHQSVFNVVGTNVFQPPPCHLQSSRFSGFQGVWRSLHSGKQVVVVPKLAISFHCDLLH